MKKTKEELAQLKGEFEDLAIYQFFKETKALKNI